MTKKIDDMLKAALDKAVKKKQAKAKIASSANQLAKDEHNKFLKKWMPKARLWIKEKLFNQITEAESNGKHNILLGCHENGIPSIVIFEAAKKIKGLKPVEKRSFPTDNYPNGAPVYYIEWDSTDPNDHRNDR